MLLLFSVEEDEEQPKFQYSKAVTYPMFNYGQHSVCMSNLPHTDTHLLVGKYGHDIGLMFDEDIAEVSVATNTDTRDRAERVR